MRSPLSFLRSIKHRQAELEELHHKAIRSANRVILADRGQATLTVELNLLCAQRREFIRIKTLYQETLRQMSWIEWCLYGKVVRQQVQDLSGLSDLTAKKIEHHKNFWHNAPVDHIDFSLLPAL